MSVATMVTHPNEWIEIEWDVHFSWSRPIPATYLDPPEGGTELDYATPTSVTFYPPEGEPYCIDHIQEGSMLALMVEAEYYPSDEDCYAACDEYMEGYQR